MTSPERVLADAIEDAAVLRANGHPAQAVSIEKVCGAMRQSPMFADLVTWISETEALLRYSFR